MSHWDSDPIEILLIIFRTDDALQVLMLLHTDATIEIFIAPLMKFKYFLIH